MAQTGPGKLGDVPMVHIRIPLISRWPNVVVLNCTKPASLYKNVLAPTDSDLRYTRKNALDTIVMKTYTGIARPPGVVDDKGRPTRVMSVCSLNHLQTIF